MIDILSKPSEYDLRMSHINSLQQVYLNMYDYAMSLSFEDPVREKYMDLCHSYYMVISAELDFIKRDLHRKI